MFSYRDTMKNLFKFLAKSWRKYPNFKTKRLTLLSLHLQKFTVAITNEVSLSQQENNIDHQGHQTLSQDSWRPGHHVLPPPGYHDCNGCNSEPPINQTIRFFHLNSLKSLPTLQSEKHAVEVRDYACVSIHALSLHFHDRWKRKTWTSFLYDWIP